MHVTVLHGDLSLPDSGKMDRRFTREDREAAGHIATAS
jgi:hypothetical protein